MTVRKQLSRLTQRFPGLRKRRFKNRVQLRWGSGDFFDELESTYWMRSSTVRRHLGQLATGHPDADWLSWLRQQLISSKPARKDGYRALVLGCGEGWLERTLAEWPEVVAIDAEDVAADVVDRARDKAEQAGLAVNYRVSDLNTQGLPEEHYDLIVAHSVLHHLDQLEFALDQIHDALRPGGVVAINEYVGPARLQYSDAAMTVINEIMAVLPGSYRISTLTGEPLSEKTRPPVDYLMSVDPSEAIRSDELHALVQTHLDVLYEAPLNGSVLQHLLYEIVANFDDELPHDRALIQLIAAYEELLHEVGTLEPDYAFYVATRRDHPATLRLERSRAAERRYFSGPGNELGQSWWSWPGVRRHLHEVPTGDPTTDWWTRAKQWLVDGGVSATSPILVIGESWLEPVLRDVATNLTFVHDDEGLSNLPHGEYHAVITTGGLGRSSIPAPELVTLLSRSMQPGAFFVVNERRDPSQRAQAFAARLAVALEPLFPAEGYHPLEARARQPPVELVAEHFTIERELACGGELLETLLGSNEATWRTVIDAHGTTLLDVLCMIERRLLEDGHLLPEHVVLFARKRPEA